MTLADIRKRLADCPIPEDARADWEGTNHYEVTTHGCDLEWWWFDGIPLMFSRKGEWWATDEGRRLGAIFDYACAYKRDVGFLLAEIERLNGKAD